MIQVDLFWSFAMGSMFAYSAKHYFATKNAKVSPIAFLVNWYFVYTVLFLSVLFAPSGAYLLWQYTSWETMFFYRRSDLHGLLPTVFAATNVLLGVFGFLLTALLIANKYNKFASLLSIYSYGIMFAILGFGYKRFLFAGDENDWLYFLDHNHTEYKLADFFHCNVFYTLLVMAIFILPPIYHSIVYWPVITPREKYQHITSMIFEITKIIVIGSLVYSIYVLYIALPTQLNQLVHLNDFDFLLNYFNEYQILRGDIKSFGYWSPLVGFVIAEIVFFSVVLFPHFLTVTSKTNVMKKSKKIQ